MRGQGWFAAVRRAAVRSVVLGAVAASAAGPAVASGGGGSVPGLPAGAAAAALRPEPVLPAPAAWPFRDAFSRTSGTGRLIDGALEWSDWVYDAYGASSPQGVPLNQITLNGAGSPAQGDYVYPSGAAGNDGADIFRAGVGLTRRDTIWRVDWNTLADPSVPIAEWTFDTDHDARTGAAAWPAAANVSSPGIEKALVVSAKGAELLDAAGGRTLARFRTAVDKGARSFVVTIPRSVLPVGGTWRVRLAAGLADAAGTGFATPTLSGGAPAPATAPRVYNITFRTAAQEPPIYTDGQTDALVARLRGALAGAPGLADLGAAGATSLVTGNFWGEDDQADTLATGDVSRFSRLVRWSQLAAGRTTAPPLLRGYSDRWYVTDVHLGQGVDATPNADPAYLGAVQPYAVYVPRDYRPGTPLPLTWMLHSLTVNYNQYGALDPRQIQEECAARDTICASPEGFGPAGGWAGNAEHDFWQVWRQLALAYRLDPIRTVISGYSMGGIGSFEIGMTYPSAFAAAMPLDGLDDSSCSGADRSANVHWVPYVISNALLDEESPWTDAESEASQFEAAGNRYAFFTTTMPEHNVTAGADGFSTQVAALHGTPLATSAPGTISYTWCANVVDAGLGLGPTSVYWLSGLSQRSASSSSQILAGDAAIPTAPEAEQVSTGVVDPPDAPPMTVRTATWQPGPAPPAAARLALTLTNAAALTVDTAAARLPGGTATVRTDGPTALTLAALAPGTVVRSGAQAVTAGAGGAATLALPGGVSVVTW